jgi:predicted negative regulator of RcsB-dependent stress response
MDEEITIINTNTRNEKIKNFFLKNKKNLIIIISIILISVIGFLSFEELGKINKIKLANEFNSAIIKYKPNKKVKTINQLTVIINKQDDTYSPLALYFLLDNNLIENQSEINNLFDVLINKTDLENEIKNLIIYKKALYNSDFVEENELIKILNPIINSESIWKSHSLYLLAEYFYEKNQKQKSKDFFNEIIKLNNSNIDIKLESEKRLNRDFSE